MATQANTISPNDSQLFGVTAIAKMVRGAPAVVYRISIPETTGSNVVELRRAALEGLIASAIEALNAADGDPDLENATGLEDAFEAHKADGPGCPVSDTRDLAWTEKVDQSFHLRVETGWNEDDEEDDDDGGNVDEDVPGFDAFSRTLANLKGLDCGPGCIISDDDCDRYY